MSSDLLCGTHAAPVVTQLRRHAPLVHCITNDVVQNFTANVLLALGASPAMVVDADEAAQFATIADALLINLGTLTRPQQQAMRAAIDSARAAGKPWTLDSVAVGALTLRTALPMRFWRSGLRLSAPMHRKSSRWQAKAAADAALTPPRARITPARPRLCWRVAAAPSSR